MNEFEYRIFIDDIPYSIHFDTHSEEYRKVIVNNKEVYYEDKNDPDFRESEIYIPIKIKDKVITLYVDEVTGEQRHDEPVHIYKIFIDGISPEDGEKITDDRDSSFELVKDGFKGYVKNKKLMKKALLTSIVLMGFAYLIRFFKNFQINLVELGLYLAGTILLFVFVVITSYFSNKSTVRKYENKFKAVIDFDSIKS